MTFLLAVGVVIIAAIWLLPEARAQFDLLVQIIQNNGMFVSAVLLPVILVMFCAIWISTGKVRSSRRDLDEYMRTEMLNQGPTSLRQKPDTPEPIPPKPDNEPPAALIVEEQIDVVPAPDAPNEESGPANKTTEDEFEAPVITRLSEELFFQPVLKMPEGDIVGYDIFRQGYTKSRKAPVFVQSRAGQTLSDRIGFEQDIIENSIAAMPRIVPPEDNLAGAKRLFIHISEAILEDMDSINDLIELFTQDQDTAAGVCLCVASTAVARNHPNTSDTISLVEKFAALGVEMALVGFEFDAKILEANKISAFSIFVCNARELLAADVDPDDTRHKLLETIKEANITIFCRDILSDADVVDTLAIGGQLLSGSFLAKPRKLKSSEKVTGEPDIGTPVSQS